MQCQEQGAQFRSVYLILEDTSTGVTTQCAATEIFKML